MNQKNLIKISIYAFSILSASIYSCKKNITSIDNTKIQEYKTTASKTNIDTSLKKSEVNSLVISTFNSEFGKSSAYLKKGWDAKTFTENGQTMKFETFNLGTKPANGYSLYISMHGGGGTTTAANNQQWENQKIMMGSHPQYVSYGIKEGVIVVPRAPVDAWDMWFQKPIYKLMDDIIQSAVNFAGVNPNKVYIMGYSAGGDGTFRLATIYADRWAAASMSAGHPGECNPVNLRNIGFALNMGGLDGAYNRNGLAREWKTKLDGLTAADPTGYKHQVNIFEDKPHWMDMKDKIAIPFMEGFVRNPYPNKVVWTQNGYNPRKWFYWLGLSDVDIKGENNNNPNKVISVENLGGNKINIKENYAATLQIYLNDSMIDFDKNLIITYQGREIFNALVKRNRNIIKQTIKDRLDLKSVYSARLDVENNNSVSVAP